MPGSGVVAGHPAPQAHRLGWAKSALDALVKGVELDDGDLEHGSAS